MSRNTAVSDQFAEALARVGGGAYLHGEWQRDGPQVRPWNPLHQDLDAATIQSLECLRSDFEESLARTNWAPRILCLDRLRF